jgi:hypothetical protein
MRWPGNDDYGMWISLRDRCSVGCSGVMTEWVAVQVSYSVSGHVPCLLLSKLFCGGKRCCIALLS